MKESKVHISLLVSAKDFLDQTQALRASDPFRTNLLGSVASSVAGGGRTYERCFWWVIADEKDKVVGAAMRTAPYGLVLSPMSREAATALALRVSVHDDQFPDVSGPTAVVRAFLNTYKGTGSSGSFREIDLEGRQLLYVLETLQMPAIEGEMTTANFIDFELLMRWFVDFAEEAGLALPNPSDSILDGLQRESWHFWIVNNEIVSMAGHAPLVKVPSGVVGRIGPVYTPPAHRRKGYAGVLTAILSQELLDKGAKVILYTDASNPTSNGVYQRIGFVAIDENEKYEFSEIE